MVHGPSPAEIQDRSDLHPISVSHLEQKQPSYPSLDPLGRVPTLVSLDGTPTAESAAILTYLVEAHPTADIGSTSLLAPLGELIYADRDGQGGPAAEGVQALAKRRASTSWDILDEKLATNDDLIGGPSLVWQTFF